MAEAGGAPHPLSACPSCGRTFSHPPALAKHVKACAGPTAEQLRQLRAEAKARAPPATEEEWRQIARQEARLELQRRRQDLLRDFGLAPFEGRLAFQPGPDGQLRALVDGADVAALLAAFFKDGARIRWLVADQEILGDAA